MSETLANTIRGGVALLLDHLRKIELVSDDDVCAALLSNEAISRLVVFVELLRRWSPRVDLVSCSSLELLVQRHILDSVAGRYLLNALLTPRNNWVFMDIGSGAGLPGVVFSALEPKRRVVLVEPREKRSIFLKEVRRELGLSSLEILRKRAEELTEEEASGAGLFIARALGKEEVFLTAASIHLEPGGYAVLMAGPSWDRPSAGGSREARLGFKQTINYTLSKNGPARQLGIWQCVAISA